MTAPTETMRVDDLRRRLCDDLGFSLGERMKTSGGSAI
jgi:hypothetical protein